MRVSLSTFSVPKSSLFAGTMKNTAFQEMVRDDWLQLTRGVQFVQRMWQAARLELLLSSPYSQGTPRLPDEVAQDLPSEAQVDKYGMWKDFHQGSQCEQGKRGLDQRGQSTCSSQNMGGLRASGIVQKGEALGRQGKLGLEEGEELGKASCTKLIYQILSLRQRGEAENSQHDLLWSRKRLGAGNWGTKS